MPEDTEVLSPPSVEGQTTENVTQGTETPSQDGSQPQNTEPTQVEGKDKQPQGTEARRPKGSDFYEHRDRTRRLEEAFKSQTQRMEEMAALIKELKDSKKPDVTDKKNWTEEDWKKFLSDPESVLSAREQRYQEQIQKLEEKLNRWDQTLNQSEQSKNEREALEMLFPKISPESEESLEERVKKDPERVDRVMQILKSTGLDDFSRTNPRQAAKLAFKLLEEKPPASPTVLKKGLMGNNARGNPGMGSQRTSSVEDKRAELKRLMAETDSNPELRFDEKHKEKREAVMRDLERLMK